LHVAAERGDAQALEILLRYGADVMVTDFRDRTALFDAVNQSNVSIVRILLSNGIDIDARDNQHQHALHEAAKYGNVEIVRLILNHVSNKVPKANGITPLDVATSEDVRRVLQDAGTGKDWRISKSP
jgi:uncharacterized protein